MSLALRNILFTLVIPGAGGAYLPWWILARRGGGLPSPTGTPATAACATALIALGIALYCYCVWQFAVVGRGTPGPWDPPRRFVAAGPYRWVRNPIYVAALAIICGEALLLLATELLIYAGTAAVAFHLFVVCHEEPALRRQFGERYETYRRTVPRWLPRPPRAQARESPSTGPSSAPNRHRHMR